VIRDDRGHHAGGVGDTADAEDTGGSRADQREPSTLAAVSLR